MPSIAPATLPVPLRLLLVEDESSLRYALRKLIELDRAYEVVGEAEDGPTAVALAEKLRPEVILTDIMMPGAFDGIEATRRILAASPQDVTPPRIVALSGSVDYSADVLAAGAVGFIPKAKTLNILAELRKILADV